MTDENEIIKFTLTPVDSIPFGKKKRRDGRIRIDVQENKYLERIGRKQIQTKQTKMTANYIQEIYNRDKKEKQKDE